MQFYLLRSCIYEGDFRGHVHPLNIVDADPAIFERTEKYAAGYNDSLFVRKFSALELAYFAALAARKLLKREFPKSVSAGYFQTALDVYVPEFLTHIQQPVRERGFCVMQ